MALDNLSTKQLLVMFNAMSEKPVKKFSTKLDAMKRTREMIESSIAAGKIEGDLRSLEVQMHEESTDSQLLEVLGLKKKDPKEEAARIKAEEKAAKEKAKADAKAAKEKAKAEKAANKATKAEGDSAGTGRGRKSAYVGKTLHGLKEVNPRRPGSFGFKSYDIIRDAGKSGISYADYAAKGGRPNDLSWDIAHGNVEVR